VAAALSVCVAVVVARVAAVLLVFGTIVVTVVAVPVVAVVVVFAAAFASPVFVLPVVTVVTVIIIAVVFLIVNVCVGAVSVGLSVDGVATTVVALPVVLGLWGVGRVEGQYLGQESGAGVSWEVDFCFIAVALLWLLMAENAVLVIVVGIIIARCVVCVGRCLLLGAGIAVVLVSGGVLLRFAAAVVGWVFVVTAVGWFATCDFVFVAVASRIRCWVVYHVLCACL
jgi:hypothetical protein